MTITPHLELRILRPALRRGEFDTVDKDGIEAKLLGQYLVVEDQHTADRPWVGGRADGTGDTYRTDTLEQMLLLLAKEIGAILINEKLKG